MTTLAQNQATIPSTQAYSTMPTANGPVKADAGTAQVLANQQAAAKLGVTIPGVGGGSQNQSTTTLSSDKTADISNIQNKTNQLSQTGVTTDSQTGVATNADNSVYTPGADNSQTEAPSNGISNGGYVGDSYYPAGSTLPQGSDGSYMGTTPYSPTDVSILNSLNDQKGQNDALTAGIISSIQNQYTQLIQQQQQTNAGQQGGETNLLLRNGGLQHTGSGQNVLSTTVSYGISQLADLNNKEQMAILQAQQAGQNEDFQLQDKINQEISSIRDDKVAAATKLNDQVAAANKTLADQKFQTQQATTSTINGILADAAKNGANADVISAIGSATTVQDAINAAGNSLQTMTGDFANYPQYKKDAIANGLVPEDATTWLQNKQTSDAREKENEAYGTAFATAQGKAASDAITTASSSVPSSPVTSPQGIVYNAPASIAPYVSFASNGVKYADLSNFAGTPTEKNQAVQDAQNAGYKVITNKNTALDVQNIADATAKLADIKTAFDKANAGNAAERDSYAAAFNTVSQKLQTDPNYAGINVYQDAALDILKAMSGVQGFRGGASIVQQVKDTFPSITDTQSYADAKINNLQKLISDRETALVGNPSASDQSLITQKENESNITTNLNNIKTSNPSLYSAASSMFTSINSDTGQPYSAADILQAFPELNSQ